LRRLTLPVLLLTFCADGLAQQELGVLARFSLDAASHTQWALPGRLQEISALAMTADGRLLTIDDERAIVYELDYEEGGLVKAFALGKPVIRADFEGIASVDDRIFLMTSAGDIYAAAEGVDGERVSYERFRSGIEAECEFEGLAEDPAGNRLLLLCKNLGKKADIDTLAIFPWDLEARAVDRAGIIYLPVADILRALQMRRVHPSGLVVDGATGRLLLVAAREQALIELDSRGRLIAATRLPLASRHPQAEGIALSADAIFIADEGGSGKGRLSVYRADLP